MLIHFQGALNRHCIRSRSGWTLVELMIATGLGMVILGAVLATTIFVSRSFAIIGNYHDLDKDSRHTLDVLSRDIRSISNLTAFSSSPTSARITLVDMTGNQIDYKWNGTNFTRSITTPGAGSAITTVMLKNCDYLSVSNYQRSASANFSFVPTSSLDQTKLIDVRWHCWRSVIGVHLTTESVQTAKIVARNF